MRTSDGTSPARTRASKARGWDARRGPDGESNLHPSDAPGERSPAASTVARTLSEIRTIGTLSSGASTSRIAANAASRESDHLRLSEKDRFQSGQSDHAIEMRAADGSRPSTPTAVALVEAMPAPIVACGTSSDSNSPLGRARSPRQRAETIRASASPTRPFGAWAKSSIHSPSISVIAPVVPRFTSPQTESHQTA
jgi:hypothetical protein